MRMTRAPKFDRPPKPPAARYASLSVKKRFRPKPEYGIVPEYMARIEELREIWGLAEPAGRRGEALPLWFRGRSDESWKLTPKLYRKAFLGAMRTRFGTSSRAEGYS
jgi:hypothetical protein